jgi:LPXTG-motif cell wall-anchored protein
VTLDSLIYLLELYWPYLLGALVIGLGAGWFSGARKKS